MKVTIIGPTYPFRGGISTYTSLLYRTMARHYKVQLVSYKRMYPTILYPGRTDLDPSKTPFVLDDVDYIIDAIGPWTWSKAVGKIVKFAPEVVILPWWNTIFAPQYYIMIKLLKKHGVGKIALICHNVMDHEGGSWKHHISKRIFKEADLLLTHSTQDTLKIKELLGYRAQVETLFLPTFKERGFKYIEQDTARRKLKLNSEHVLLFFGYVRHYKGVDLLLEAIPAILKKKNVTLLVVGDFLGKKKKYARQVKRLKIEDSVRLVDSYIPDEEVGVYFSAADLIVQPYRTASGSGICQLAYGLNRPVVATRHGSLSEVIEDGENGILLDLDEPDALAAAVIDGLESEMLFSMMQAARNTKHKFSWQRYLQLLTEAFVGVGVARQEYLKSERVEMDGLLDHE